MFPVRVPDPVEFGDAIDQLCDLRAELAAQLVEGEIGVLDRVVKKGCGDGFRVQPILSKHERDSQWVRYEWISGFSNLAGVGLCRNITCSTKQLDVAVGMMHPEGIEDVDE